MLVYTEKISERIRYSFETVLRERLGIAFSFTDDEYFFEKYDGNKINYSKKKFKKCLNILPVGLLHERGINPAWNNTYCNDEEPTLPSAYPEDIFSAIFYHLSSYREYVRTALDKHGRTLPDKCALMHKVPIVDMWIENFSMHLNQVFPDLTIKKNKYSAISTIDVDTAYAFSNKHWAIALGGYLKSLLNLDIETIKLRTSVLMDNEKDPYDTFEYLQNVHNCMDIQSIFFFLLADYGRHDRNICWKNKNYRKLIKEISSQSEVGIHLSYHSVDDMDRMKKEIFRLESILEKPVRKSRQHYLRLRLPITYRYLEALGIEEDYSMGYPTEDCFRTATSFPYYFYDLDQEKKLNVKIHPISYMEITYQHYKKLSPEQALICIRQKINIVKKYNGSLVSLWHNESVSEYKHWKGWRKVFEEAMNNMMK